MSEPPPRVRVTAPRSGRPRPGSVPAGPQGTGAPAAVPEAQSELEEVLTRSLLREQLRLALRALTALGLTLGLLPLLFHLLEPLQHARVGPLPLAWLLLGVLTYPWLVLLGWLFIRRAESNERDFADLVGSVLPEERG